ncbi:unnamed protein product, partial [Cylicostephanus goldi]
NRSLFNAGLFRDKASSDLLRISSKTLHSLRSEKTEFFLTTDTQQGVWMWRQLVFYSSYLAVYYYNTFKNDISSSTSLFRNESVRTVLKKHSEFLERYMGQKVAAVAPRPARFDSP